MKNSRREFLKIAGLAALGVGTGAAAMAYQPHPHRFTPRPEALTAKRWGMVVDTRKFHSAKDFQPLIEACHAYHNVPVIPRDKKHQDIKWIWYDSFHHVFPNKHNEFPAHKVHEKPFLLLCNHCDDPPCVRVCPTKATFKREDGIVLMDMHRCIGCRFCMAGCPYGARSFNFMKPRDLVPEDKLRREFPTRMRGVVEKCNFCAERLAEGMMPACVEASEGKLLFGDLEDPNSEVRHALEHNFSIRRKPDLGTNPSVFYLI
jgi:molybdopterin-containing oxidoreductase family iron-sulfur binding subunit